jgi:hypothetical protein
VRRVLPSSFPAPLTRQEEKTIKSTKAQYPSNPKPSFNPMREVKRETPKPREESFVCIFCGRAGHLDEFCFQCKRIGKRCFDYARNSYRDEIIDFPPRSYSHALPRTYSCFSSFLSLDLTIAYMVLVHERTALSIDALVTAHVLIMVIISRIGPVFLLESLALTLSPNTWTIHVFPIVVHVPLGQVVRCKGL